MRLAILTQYYPPEVGAPQARLSELARRFTQRGHEVVVLTAMPNYPKGKVYPGYGGLFRTECWQGSQVIRTYVYATGEAAGAARLANFFSFVASSAIVGSFRLSQADFLLTNSPPLFVGISGFLLSRLKRARYIFNVADLWPESAVNVGAVREGWALRAAFALERFCYSRAWLVTGQSKTILKSITDRYPKTRCYHLSGGVDTALFTPEKRSPEVREELSNGHSCVAVYSGLHGKFQGLEHVLECSARLDGSSGIGIALVGDGSEKTRLQEQAKSMRLENVRFLESFPREKMPQLLASADIALVSLKRHVPGMVPSKIYEAMAAGLPILLTAEGEAAEIVRETGSGLVVKPGDSEAMASALTRLAESPELRQELGANGRRVSVERFDRDSITDRFIDFLEAEAGCRSAK